MILHAYQSLHDTRFPYKVSQILEVRVQDLTVYGSTISCPSVELYRADTKANAIRAAQAVASYLMSTPNAMFKDPIWIHDTHQDVRDNIQDLVRSILDYLDEIDKIQNNIDKINKETT